MCRLEALHGGAGPANVDVAVDPDELERLGPGGLEQLYRSAAGSDAPGADYSDMVAANAARKRKAAEAAAAKNKKSKDGFKF